MIQGTLIEIPQNWHGTSEEQLRQIYSYLFRLSESLNVALTNLSPDSYIEAYQRSQKGIGNEIRGLEGLVNRNNKSVADTFNDLRALIHNTASEVYVEMDRIQSELNSSVHEISEEWGEYKENIHSTIEQTARETISSYGYDSAISTLQEQAAGFSQYQIHTEGYIRQGFIDYDEYNVPIIGIAIGQNLKSVTVTVDGEEYQQFDATQTCAFYTSEKVSFRVNGVEVAYISNQKLFINDVEITGSVIFRGKWKLDFPDDDIDISWIGEDVTA